ncbi:MAG: hypothetical protein QM594_16345 [Niabella sp.]
MIPVLLITNKGDITTDFVVKSLRESQVPFYRLNTEDIGSVVILNFDLKRDFYSLTDLVLNITIDLTKIRSVYFRRPELPPSIDGLTSSEQLFVAGEFAESLEALYKILRNARWLNNVEAIRGAENKIYQLQVAKKIGFLLPDSIITTDIQEANKFYSRNERDCIIKPIRTGSVGINDTEEGVIFTSLLKIQVEDLNRVSTCPTYLQKHIPKKGDIRVTIVGDELFAVMIHSQHSDDSKVDWRKSQSKLLHSHIDLPKDIAEKCLQLTKKLSLNFGAIDLILTSDGEYVFLEINPNGQWAWIERLVSLPISKSITQFLIKN